MSAEQKTPELPGFSDECEEKQIFTDKELDELVEEQLKELNEDDIEKALAF
ncbi:MAG: hypothetical protein RL154_1346 [Pseudomonadota bacterium]